MSPREWKFFVEDILSSIARIQRFVEGSTVADFVEDEKTQSAVVREMILIGEAVRHIPEEIVKANPDVPWREMRDMRNFAVHVYWGVEPEVVWDTAMDDLPAIVSPLTRIMTGVKE